MTGLFFASNVTNEQNLTTEVCTQSTTHRCMKKYGLIYLLQRSI